MLEIHNTGITTSSIHSYNTKSFNMPFQECAKLWNEIPSSLRDLPNKLFKLSIENKLLRGYSFIDVKGREHEMVRCRIKTQGQQALSWYSNNSLLASPLEFQSLNINPRKLDKDKSNKTLNINDLEITNTELIKLLRVHQKISTSLSILANYVLRQARKLEYSHVFGT